MDTVTHKNTGAPMLAQLAGRAIAAHLKSGGIAQFDRRLQD